MDKGGPIRVEAINFTYPDEGIWDNPIDYAVHCEFESGTQLIISNKVGRGTRWIGEDGWVSVDRGRIEASNKDWIRESNDRGEVVAYKSNCHRRNFVEGVRTRKECICPAETGHRAATPGHIGYVSDALKRPLKWDPVNEKIVDDPEADRMLNAIDYRGDWAL